MDPVKLLSRISRDFLQYKNVYKYRMNKVSDMTDNDVISACHCFYEEHRLHEEWFAFREKCESAYNYCPYLDEFIDSGLCYDLQMVSQGFINVSVLPKGKIDVEQCAKYCFKCKYSL